MQRDERERGLLEGIRIPAVNFSLVNLLTGTCHGGAFVPRRPAEGSYCTKH